MKQKNKSLFSKLLPALKAKVSKLQEFGINYIDENDIWNYLVEKEWDEKEKNIDELVSDILNVPGYLIKDYLLENRKNNNSNNSNVLL